MTDKETQVRITCAVTSTFTTPRPQPIPIYQLQDLSLLSVSLKLNTLVSST